MAEIRRGTEKSGGGKLAVPVFYAELAQAARNEPYGTCRPNCGSFYRVAACCGPGASDLCPHCRLAVSLYAVGIITQVLYVGQRKQELKVTAKPTDARETTRTNRAAR